jgi:hypothetical protein
MALPKSKTIAIYFAQRESQHSSAWWFEKRRVILKHEIAHKKPNRHRVPATRQSTDAHMSSADNSL